MGLLATHPSPSLTLNASSFSPSITRTHFGVERGATGVNEGLKKTKKRGIAAARVSPPTSHFLGTGGKSTFGYFNEAQPRVRNLHIVRASLSEADAITPGSELDVLPPEEELSQATLIWRAVKLPIYSVAVIPLSVGAAAASLQSGVFDWGRYWLLFGSSFLVITWLNLSNDAYDAETGVDKDKKESVVNMTGRKGS